MSHFLSELAAIPSGVQHAAEVLARLDQCFITGFGRMSEREVNAVTSLPRLFSSTPLGPKVKEACDALLRSEFVEKHFASLACARGQHFRVLCPMPCCNRQKRPWEGVHPPTSQSFRMEFLRDIMVCFGKAHVIS